MREKRKFYIGRAFNTDCWYSSEHRTPRKRKKDIKRRGMTDALTTMVELMFEAKSDH